jgi:hypothetical protein
MVSRVAQALDHSPSVFTRHGAYGERAMLLLSGRGDAEAGSSWIEVNALSITGRYVIR